MDLLSKIKKSHEENTLLESQCKSAKEYLRKIRFEVPLDDLYQVSSSCQYDENSEFCPVLVEAKNEGIHDGPNDKFMLQVWNRQGVMLYEKKMAMPNCKWNISGNMFVF